MPFLVLSINDAIFAYLIRHLIVSRGRCLSTSRYALDRLDPSNFVSSSKSTVLDFSFGSLFNRRSSDPRYRLAMSDTFLYTYPSPLEGYENLPPLPDELNEDG